MFKMRLVFFFVIFFYCIKKSSNSCLRRYLGYAYTCSNMTREEFLVQFDSYRLINGYYGTYIEEIDLDSIELISLEKNLFTLSYNDINLEHVSSVYINNCSLISIQEDTFSHFIHLNTLVITKNNLKHFNGAFLDTLSSLTHLSLSQNKIDEISINCTNYKNLTSLILNNNQFHTLSNVIHFINCSNLENFYCNNCKIHKIDKKILKDLPKLDSLYLSNNFIQNLSFLSHENNNLDFLSLRNNSISSFDYLNNLANLQSIDLSHNLLQFIPSNLFSNLKFIYYIMIEDNEISKIEQNAFSNLMQAVRFSTKNAFKNLNILYSNIFDGLNNIYRLDLDAANITKIEQNAFSNMTTLEHLLLNFNNIIHLENNTFIGLINLHELSLSNSGIETLQTNTFKGLISLKILDLSSNKLTYLPSFLFNDTRKLGNLNLEDNKISTINNNAFVGLEDVLIFSTKNSFYNLHTLHKNIFNNLSSYRLNLSSSGIQTIENNVFYHFTELQVLNLSYNSITYLPCNLFSNNNKLSLLDLNTNQLTKLSVCTFYQYKNLKTLSLDSNNITQFQIGIFSSLKELTYLDISNNQLSYINETLIHPLENLVQLYLTNNLLNNTNIPNVIEHLPLLKVIDVSGNYWFCSNLVVLKKYLISREIKFDNIIKDFYYENIDGIKCINDHNNNNINNNNDNINNNDNENNYINNNNIDNSFNENSKLIKQLDKELIVYNKIQTLLTIIVIILIGTVIYYIFMKIIRLYKIKQIVLRRFASTRTEMELLNSEN